MRHLVLHGPELRRTCVNARAMAKPMLFPPQNFRLAAPMKLVVALTRSGTTTEVLRLLETVQSEAGPRTVAITADPSTPVVELADRHVILDFADEKSVVQTRFATTSLALWRAWLGEDLTAVVTQGQAALADPLPRRALDSSQFTFLGSGMSVGIANEAALKLREASQSLDRVLPGHGIPSRSYQRGWAILDSLGVRSPSAWAAGGPQGDRRVRGKQRS